MKKHSINDVVDHILIKRGVSMSQVKLHNLLYYCQAWSMVWDNCPLFNEKIYAVKWGAVVINCYIGGALAVSTKKQESALKKKAKKTVDAVLEAYGDKSLIWLSEQIRMEPPWKKANGEVIKLKWMRKYYKK